MARDGLSQRFRKLNPRRTPIRESDPAQRACLDEEILAPYTREEAIAEARRCLYCHEPSCVSACPINQDCREYNLLISKGDFDGAARIILRDNPICSTLSRVCYHYCERMCVVGIRGQPVAIRQLKRAALEYAQKDFVYKSAAERDERVAVVGAGPAGLMVMWILGQKGYRITVFEKKRILGGLATQTIPTFRLKREVFEEDMGRFRGLNVRFVMGRALGTDFTLEDLRKDFDAVFLGIGTHKPQQVRLIGEEKSGVYTALELLEDAAMGVQVRIGERVAVIGGGDVAMDCARTALRLGANDVVIVYRRSRHEMPASDEEVKEATDEGVKFMFLTSPLEVLGEDVVVGLRCQKMVLGEPDASGRRRPVPIPGTEFVLPVDSIILAVGQVVDLKSIPDAEKIGIRASEDGVIIGLDETGRTNLPGVYVGGGTSIVHAMAAGKDAALAIDSYLSSKVKRPIETV